MSEVNQEKVFHDTEDGLFKVEITEPVQESPMQFGGIEQELVILTKHTIDIFLRTKHFGELTSLYTFYYYTAKWQKTNQIKCTTSFVSKGIGWDRKKVIKYKKMLCEFGLISDVKNIDKATGKIKGWYLKMNYIFKKETLENHCTDLPHCGSNHRVDKRDTNALSSNSLNALSPINKILKADIKNVLYEFLLEIFNKDDIKKYIFESPKEIKQYNNLLKKFNSLEDINRFINTVRNDKWIMDNLSPSLLNSKYDAIMLNANKKITQSTVDYSNPDGSDSVVTDFGSL